MNATANLGKERVMAGRPSDGEATPTLGDAPDRTGTREDIIGNGATRDILGVRVVAPSWAEALDFFSGCAIEGTHQRVVNFLNANNANLACTDPAFRAILGRSIVLPDGIGVDIGAQLIDGARFPANLNGTDFVPALLRHIEKPLAIALVGASPDVIRRAAGKFQAMAPQHRIHAVADGYFDRERSNEVTAALAALAPDITLVAMGTPMQERWIDAHIHEGHGRLVFGVGALFDFMSGEVKRAPDVMRKLRLEWVYRLALEPGRLWRRYVLGNPVFLLRVLRYKFSGK